MTSRAKVLLVDDVQAILDEERRILEAVPALEVLECTTGAAAIKAIATQRPDIVFLDLVLPDLSGEQICRAIKAKPDLADTAIIIVTGKDDPDQLQRAFEVGCDAYVTKPFEASDLLEKVRILLAEKGILLEDEE